MITITEERSDGSLSVTKTVRRKRCKVGKERLQAKLESYFTQHLAVSGEIADIESLADYLGTTRDGLFEMMRDESTGEILKRARNRIAMIKKQLAFNGKIPASVLAFDLKNNHGYRDKPEDGDGNASEGVIISGRAADWAK